MIDVTNLSKAYGPIQALDNVSFSVAEGEIVGMLGPNGAGKTTIIKTLTGYLQPDDGTVTVDGLDVLTERQQVQARIGYLPENAPLYPELSVQSSLKLMADLRGIPAGEQRACISDAVRAVGLVDRLTQSIGTLSKGYRQRVGLAQAILHKPKLLILDEPSVGLDPTQIVEIRHLIRRLAEHSTILFSSHILPEVEALCQRAIIIMNGRVRADARLADLSAGHDALLLLDGAPSGVDAALRGLPGVITVLPLDTPPGQVGWRVQAPPGADLCSAIYALAASHNWPLRELRSERQTLETVFNRLASGDDPLTGDR